MSMHSSPTHPYKHTCAMEIRTIRRFGATPNASSVGRFSTPTTNCLNTVERSTKHVLSANAMVIIINTIVTIRIWKIISEKIIIFVKMRNAWKRSL